jgi:WD40 repeat protein/DNA-binding transcriptional regulator YiaG
VQKIIILKLNNQGGRMRTASLDVVLERFTTFGDLLKFLRRRAGLTQRELSIAVGYSDAQISRLEQNDRLPDMATISARFLPVLMLEDQPRVADRLLELAATVRREDAPASGLPPYKGLFYFEESDSELFFGREKLTTSLVQRLLSGLEAGHRFLTVIGASGSGKSSLVRAGLIPALHWRKESSGWLVHVMTPTAHPLEALADTLNGHGTTQAVAKEFAGTAQGLQKILGRLAKNAGAEHTLLVIDQFEELFTLCQNEDEQHTFIENVLTAALQPNGKALVVIAMRADFYAHCAQFDLLRQAVSSHQEYIGPMSMDDLRRAIEEPARHGHWEIEPGLVEVLLHDVGADVGRVPEPGALPLLSHALLETWQRRRGHTLTLSGYIASGGVRGAIAETAETVFYDKLDQRQRNIARQIFLRLTELGGDSSTADTRRKVGFEELVSKQEDRDTVREVLSTLADARLITTDQDVAEVAHEALIREWPTLRNWLEENREGLRLHRHLTVTAQEWDASRRDPSMLYRGARLVQALEWVDDHRDDLNLLERTFLHESKSLVDKEAAEREAQRQRELESAQKLAETEKARAKEHSLSNKRLRQRAWVLTGILGIAILLAFLATNFARTANTNLDFAQSANTQMVSERNRADNERDAAIAAQATSQAEAYARATAEALAENQASLAFSRELSAAAVSNLQLDSERSALLALQAMEVSDILEARNALRQSLPALHLLKSISAHNQAPGVNYSPDGKQIASIEYFGGETKLWNAENYQLLHTFPGESDVLGLDVVISPDGKTLANLTSTNIVFWDIPSGQRLFSLDSEDNEEGLANVSGHIAFSPEGERLAVSNFMGLPRVFDVTSRKEIFSLAGHEGVAEGLAYSLDGKLIATSDANGIIKIWNALSGQEILALGHPGWIHAVAFSPDSTRLASASETGTFKVWDTGTGNELLRLQGGLSGLYDIDFTPDGKKLVTCGKDGSVRVRDVEFGQEYLNLTSSTSTVIALAVSPDGTRIVSSAYDGTLKIWDAIPRGELFALLGHDNAAWGVDYKPDGSLLASAGIDGKINIWDANTGKLKMTIPRAGDEIADGYSSIAFSPDGRYLAAGGFSGTTYLWDVETGRLIRSLSGHKMLVINVGFSKNSKRLITGSFDNTARIWDLSSGKELLLISGVWYGAVFSPDGKSVFGGHLDQSVHRWDVSSGEDLAQYSGEGKDVYDIAISPDGKTLAFSRQDGVVTFWDIETGEKINTITAHGAIVARISFSRDGRYLATASFDRLAKVWDLQTGQEVATLFGNNGDVFDAIFSPDGSRVATASTDGTVRIYIMEIDKLIGLAKSRLTRTLTEAECQKYLHMESCPSE